MTDTRQGRSSRSDPEGFRDLARRVTSLERSKTARAGRWVISERDGLPVFTKPGAAPLDAGQTTPDVIPLAAPASPYTKPPDMWDLLNIADDTAATLLVEGDTVLLSMPSVGTTQVRGAYRALDAESNYTIEAHIDAAMINTGTVRAGLMLRQSSTGKLIVFGPLMSSGAKLAAGKFDSPTAFNANYLESPTSDLLYGMPQWMRIRDDGTNRYFEYSYNGELWMQFHTPVGCTDFLTPDQAGIAGVNIDSGQPCQLLLSSFAEI